MKDQEEIFEIKVTKIKNRWHARLFHKERGLMDEMACDTKENIGYICYTMLRWMDKMGWCSPMAHATRQRQKYKRFPGKIWYQNKLQYEQSNRKS